MKFDFSAEFLRVTPPDTNFGEAWESLCDHLLRAEFGSSEIARLKAPDRGIDILHRLAARAYQCKSSERGALGSIDPDASSKSLETAWQHRSTFGWNCYCLSTNANYTGVGMGKILEQANTLGMTPEQIIFLGPEYWDSLCVKYEPAIQNRFDYRLTATADQVVDAFRKARYFDRYIAEHEEKIREGHFSLVVTNNRTPLEIEIPFSPELTVENYLDVAKQLLGISLEWTNFGDLGTSTGPRVSVIIDRKAQPFKTKIKDLSLEAGDRLQIWLTVVWRDEEQKTAIKEQDTELYAFRQDLSMIKFRERFSMTATERRQLTVNRGEAILQSMIWRAARELLRGSQTQSLQTAHGS